jgi:hypothetical protein
VASTEYWLGCLICNHRFEIDLDSKGAVRCPGNCSPGDFVTPPRKGMERCDCTPKPMPTPKVYQPAPAVEAPPEKKAAVEFRFL